MAALETELYIEARSRFAQLMQAGAARLEREARINAAGISQRLADGVETGVDELGIYLRLRPEAAHGWRVEYGRGAIRGKRMTWRAAGGRVWARRVDGVAARPFLRPARDDVSRWMRESSTGALP